MHTVVDFSAVKNIYDDLDIHQKEGTGLLTQQIKVFFLDDVP